MDLFSYPCLFCGGNNIHPHSKYLTQHQGKRTIHHCRDCDYYYSDTYDTPIAGLRTPLSRIIAQGAIIVIRLNH